MKIIIAGSRKIKNKQKVFALLDKIFEKLNLQTCPIIISGKADGMDALGEEYAKLHNWPIKEFPADWKKYDKAAGPIRNQEMIDYGPDLLICFYLKDSKGSKDIMSRAKKNNIKIISLMFNEM